MIGHLLVMGVPETETETHSIDMFLGKIAFFTEWLSVELFCTW